MEIKKTLLSIINYEILCKSFLDCIITLKYYDIISMLV